MIGYVCFILSQGIGITEGTDIGPFIYLLLICDLVLAWSSIDSKHDSSGTPRILQSKKTDAMLKPKVRIFIKISIFRLCWG